MADMAAWVAEAYGPPADLKLTRAPRPSPAPGEALVRVAFAALNFADGLMIRGRYQVRPPPPFIPGFEVSGEVVAVGPGVSLRIGQKVCGQMPWGGFAEYVVADARRWIPLADDADLAQAAALPVSFVTAHVALFERARLLPGESLVVLAGAGALGLAALQLARDLPGLRVAITSGGEKARLALANGATHALSYRDEGWDAALADLLGERGADVVADPVGGELTLSLLKHMAWRGRLLLLGFAGGRPAQLPANRLLVRCLSAMGVFWSEDLDGPLLAQVRADLSGRLQAGAIRPVVSAVVPFEALPEAIAGLESGATVGKLVLSVA